MTRPKRMTRPVGSYTATTKSKHEDELWVFAEAAEVFGDGIFVAGWAENFCRESVRLFVVRVSLQLRNSSLSTVRATWCAVLSRIAGLPGERWDQGVAFRISLLHTRSFLRVSFDGIEKLVQVCCALLIGEVQIFRRDRNGRGGGSVPDPVGLPPGSKSNQFPRPRLHILPPYSTVVAVAARIGAALRSRPGLERTAGPGLTLLSLLATSLLGRPVRLADPHLAVPSLLTAC